MLVLLGEASFALYMTHYLVMLLVVKLMPGMNRPPIAYMTFLATSVLCVAISVLVFQCFERPVEKMIRRRIGTPRQQISAESLV